MEPRQRDAAPELQILERHRFGAVLPCPAGGYGPLGELEHVGAFGVLGAFVALLGWQGAIWVYLRFESLEERFSGWAGARASVVGARP
jgi:hypothetical protein